MNHRLLLQAAFWLLLPLGVSGCNIVGFATQAVQGTQMIDPAYKGFADQTCGVMVYADNGLLSDEPTVQLDTAMSLQAKFTDAAKLGGATEVKNIKWVDPASILQFQRNYTDMDDEAVETVAPRFGVSRLIYISIDTFELHPNDSPDLVRGSYNATVEVVEVKNGKGKIVFTQRVSAVAPKNCPPEGMPDLPEKLVYKATCDAFTSETAKLFLTHESDAQS